MIIKLVERLRNTKIFHHHNFYSMNKSLQLVIMYGRRGSWDRGRIRSVGNIIFLLRRLESLYFIHSNTSDYFLSVIYAHSTMITYFRLYCYHDNKCIPAEKNIFCNILTELIIVIFTKDLWNYADDIIVLCI